MITNKRHKAFADEYLSNGMNGTQAYLSVYKGVKKEETARVNSSKLLTNTNIKAYIEEKQKELAKSKQIDQEFIINEYLQLLDSCKVEGNDGKGTIKDRTNWAKALAQLTKMLGLDAVQKIEIDHKGFKGLNIITDDEDE
jgi:hypothetical protein